MERQELAFTTDVLVIGGGLAGTMAALKVREQGKQALLVDKARTGSSGCSAFAAGVMVLFLPEEDDAAAWMRSAVEHSNYMTDQEWLAVVREQISQRVREMAQWGVNFRKTPDGKLDRRLMRGGGEGHPIKMAMFDGPEMMRVLRRRASLAGVQLLDRVMFTGLLLQDGTVTGAVGFDTRDGSFVVISAKSTIIATGGTAYKLHFANHKMNAGDGTAIAYEAGAAVRNFEFCRHHSSSPLLDIEGLNMFVALGGKFINAQGEEFLHDYDRELGNKTLTDRFSQAMALEVLAGRGPINFDMTHLSPGDVASLDQGLPLMMRSLRSAGIVQGQQFAQKIEWNSTIFGTLGSGGGIAINSCCQTTLPGLYAAGDATDRPAAAGGSHGAGALAFAAVSGAIAGQQAASDADRVKITGSSNNIEHLRHLTFAPLGRKTGIESEHLILALQEVIHRWDVFIVQSRERLKGALAKIRGLQAETEQLIAYDPHYLRLAHETRSMLVNAELWLQAALAREESRGPVLREDFPDTDNDTWLKWTVLQKNREQTALNYEPIPFEKYAIKPPAGKRLHRSWEAARKRGVQWG